MAIAFAYCVLFVAGTSLPFVYAHSVLHGFHVLQAVLAIFSWLNVMICWWEVGLFINRGLIKTQYLEFKRKLPPCTLPQPMFLFRNASLEQALDLKYWALVWSTYSLIDPSYSDQTTFGFFVDVGNGFTTLLPSIIWASCMTWPLLPARVVGLMGFVLFYQECYGTFIYFFSFLLNKRWKGQGSLAIGIVVVANNIWVVMPLIGLYTSWHLIDSNDFSVFRHALS